MRFDNNRPHLDNDINRPHLDKHNNKSGMTT